MPETGLFTRITDGLKAHFNPLHGSEDGLLFWIEELPQPRDTGSLIIACGGQTLGEIHGLNLCSPDPNPVLQQIAPLAKVLHTCTARRLAFKNIAPWLETEIRKELVRLRVRVAA